MNLQFYLEKLFASYTFKEFKSKNKDCYFCSAFFSWDKQENNSQQHIDFYVPSKKESFSFQLENNLGPISLEKPVKLPEKIQEDINIDFDYLEEMILERMKTEKITNKIHKLLFSLQNLKGNNFIIGTIFISGMGLIKITINLDEMKIIDFQKKSFLDMFKIIRK